MPSIHDLVTASLVYLCAGGLLWVLLDYLGIVEATFIARSKPGKPLSAWALVLPTIAMIVLWPWFIVNWVRGMRGVRR